MRRARSATAVALALWTCLAGAASALAGTPDLRVRGRHLVDGPGRGHVVQLRGVDRSGTEYACIQGWGIFQGPDPARGDSAAMIAAMKSWDIDVVRVPLNEDCWLGINSSSRDVGATYRAAIERYVHALGAAHLYVILDLHWAAPGGTPATGQLPMADADHAPAFWHSVARAFRRDHALVFDLFNEPYGISWTCWRSGCEIPASGATPAYRSAGMQQLVDAVRAAGATQPLMLGGLQYAFDLSGWLAAEPHDRRHALLASEHDYGGLSPCTSSCRAAIVATARRVPVVLGELGETDCATGYIEPMMRFADAHGVGYLGWAWDATSSGWNCASGPALIENWQGTPTPFGTGFEQHFRALGTAARPG